MPIATWWMPKAHRCAILDGRNPLRPHRGTHRRAGDDLGHRRFIALMLFIIWKLAIESKAGRFGTFVLFFVLAFGILGSSPNR